MKTLDNLKERLQENGWAVEDCGIGPDSNSGWEISKHSPAGEDFNFAIEHNDDVEQAIQEIKDYANVFDVDEHIEMWVKARQNGVSGVPNTRELCEDAQAIKEMLEELAENISDETPPCKNNLEDLISQANAISKQAQQLSQNLQKHKDHIVLEH